MHTPTTLITDVMEAVSNMKSKLEEISKSEAELPFIALEEDDNVVITAKATNMPATLAFKQKHKLTENEQKKYEKYTNVASQEYTVKPVKEGKVAVKKIKENLISKISDCIDSRFTEKEDHL